MKRSKKILMFFVLCIAVLSFLGVTNLMSLINQGHWLYNEQGVKIGCKSPGDDCTWS